MSSVVIGLGVMLGIVVDRVGVVVDPIGGTVGQLVRLVLKQTEFVSIVIIIL